MLTPPIVIFDGSVSDPLAPGPTKWKNTIPLATLTSGLSCTTGGRPSITWTVAALMSWPCVPIQPKLK